MQQICSEARITLPSWMEEEIGGTDLLATDEERMELVVRLARQNVLRGTGGPFGAAVFAEGGRLVAVGVNSVERLHNSSLHAEVVALTLAEVRVRSFTLRAPGLPGHMVVSSCEPCAMCLGAVLWSGAGRLVCGAQQSDATAVGFDEGPVFPESYRYLEERGVAVVRGVLRAEARAVLELYRERGGLVYNR